MAHDETYSVTTSTHQGLTLNAAGRLEGGVIVVARGAFDSMLDALAFESGNILRIPFEVVERMYDVAPGVVRGFETDRVGDYYGE